MEKTAACAKKILFCFVGFMCFFFCFLNLMLFLCLLVLQVRRLGELGVDGLTIIAAHPLVLLVEDVAAAVAQVVALVDDNRSELRDITLGLRGRRRRGNLHLRGLDRRGGRSGCRLCNRLRRGGSRRRSSLGLSSSLSRALLLRRRLSLVAPLALGLLRGRLRGLLRVAASLRRGLAGAGCSGGRLLGRRPALEAREQVLVADAVVVGHLLAVLLNSRQLALNVLAVLLADEALQLTAACQQDLAHVLRELNPAVGLLLGRVGVALLLCLLDLLAHCCVNLDAALGRHGQECRELRRGEREGNGNERCHFESVSRYF